jgi:hypothetical protein
MNQRPLPQSSVDPFDLAVFRQRPDSQLSSSRPNFAPGSS